MYGDECDPKLRNRTLQSNNPMKRGKNKPLEAAYESMVLRVEFPVTKHPLDRRFEVEMSW